MFKVGPIGCCVIAFVAYKVGEAVTTYRLKMKIADVIIANDKKREEENND